MKAAAWRLLLRRPMTASLTLSLALHCVFIFLLQSRPFNRSTPTTLVISARLVEAVQPLAPAAPLPAAIPVKPVPAPKAESAEKSQPLPAPARNTPAESALPSLELGVDSTWYLARQVDEQPRPLGKIEPVYPEEARRLHLGCSLKLRLRIDAQGRVREAEVVEANPAGIFDAAALEAFSNARFMPAIKEGRPVRMEAFYRLECK